MSDRLRFVYWPPNTEHEPWQQFDQPSGDASGNNKETADAETAPGAPADRASREPAEPPVNAPSGNSNNAPDPALAETTAQTEEPVPAPQARSQDARADESNPPIRQASSADQQPQVDASMSFDAIARFDAASQRYAFEAAEPAALRAELASASSATGSSADLPTATAATNASAWPFNSVALIITEFDSFPGGYFIGTGVAIGPNTILTASHNVWQSNTLDEADHVYIYTGFSGVLPLPGGGNPTINDTGWTVDYFEVGESSGNGISPRDSAQDYAAITVNHTFDSWFGISTEFGENYNRSGIVNMTGYPFAEGGSQDNDRGGIKFHNGYQNWQHTTLDPRVGNSGGPLWYDADPGPGVDPMLVGIVSSTGYSASMGTSQVDQINDWLQSHGRDPVTGVSNNNGVAGSPGGIGGLADLVAQSLQLDATFGWSDTQSLTLQAEAVNIGSGPAAGTTNPGAYLSPDSTITTSDVSLQGSDLTYQMGAGLSQDISIQFRIPDSVRPGEYYIGVIVDHSDRIQESDETNNASEGVKFIVTPFTNENDTLALTPALGEWYALAGDDHVTFISDESNVFGAKVFGGDGNDTLTGTDNADALRGDAGNDTVSGGDGNDNLRGGAGNDVVNGGAGNDQLHAEVADGDDAYDGGEGIDAIYFSALTQGVTVNLAAGTASGAEIGTDSIVNVEYVTGSLGNDTISGNDAANSITGKGGSNTLAGGAGNDTLYGAEGDDTLEGGDGDDTVWAGTGDNLIIAGLGDDFYGGGADTDTLSFVNTTQGVSVDLVDRSASGAETGTDLLIQIENVIGGAGDDTIIGSDLANAITGHDGNDRFEGGAGNDTVDGGAGTDTVSFKSTTQGVNVNLAAGTATGTETDTDTIIDVENAEGGAGNDVIRGDGSANTIAGLAGDDKLWAGIGDDHMTGGDGKDVLRGEAGNDTLDGGDGNDALAGHAGDDKLFGGGGNDFLYGNGDNDMLWGGTGNDVLKGNEGADILRGESGADYMNGGDGNDALAGHQGADQMFGGAGNDFLYGNGDDDQLWGGTGNDVLKGNEGADILRGEDGNDYLDGGDENDALAGHAGADTLLGGGGNDFLYGNGDNDTLFGGTGNDVLKGESGNDILNGEDGNDYLDGGTGADTVNGGGGADTLLGGADTDTFVFADGAGSDTIRDWEDGTDVLDFSGITSVTTIADLTIETISATQTDISYDDGTGTVTLTILSSSAFTIDQSDTIL